MKKMKMLSKNAGNGRLWTLIVIELAVAFSLIFVSTYQNWPFYLIFRPLVLLPIYHAGYTLGISGGLMCSIITSLIYAIIIPFDLQTMEKTFAISYSGLMFFLFNAFSVLIGGTIGRSKQMLKEISSLSGIFIKIATEAQERHLMLTMAREAMSALEAKLAAYCMPEENGDGSRLVWKVFCISPEMDEPEEIPGLDATHPLVAVAVSNAPLMSNSIMNDDRFTGGNDQGPVNSMIIVPVTSGGETFGSLMVAGKTNGDLFKNKDLSLVTYLTSAAADIIHTRRQESIRREESLKEERMKNLFSRFVSLSVAESLLNNPELLNVRWETITMLVSDIRDFTTISGNLPPGELVSQLNEYFSRMVDIVFENNGTIDKFIGDCIVAYWGAPTPDPEHAGHAAAAALGIAEATRRLNEKWLSEGKPLFRNGIAIHTGRALLGNIGDDRKRAFTIMGDEVDRAIELESLTKWYSGKILVSQETASELKGCVSLEKVEPPEGSGYSGLFHLVT